MDFVNADACNYDTFCYISMADAYKQESFHFSINENYMYTKSCTEIITYIWVHSETRFKLHTPKTRYRHIQHPAKHLRWSILL